MESRAVEQSDPGEIAETASHGVKGRQKTDEGRGTAPAAFLLRKAKKKRAGVCASPFAPEGLRRTGRYEAKYFEEAVS